MSPGLQHAAVRALLLCYPHTKAYSTEVRLMWAKYALFLRAVWHSYLSTCT